MERMTWSNELSLAGAGHGRWAGAVRAWARYSILVSHVRARQHQAGNALCTKTRAFARLRRIASSSTASRRLSMDMSIELAVLFFGTMQKSAIQHARPSRPRPSFVSLAAATTSARAGRINFGLAGYS